MQNIIAPSECPSCGYSLVRIKDQLFCQNTSNCPAQNAGKVQAFCKKLKIKGFGEKTIESLNLSHINHLATLTPEYMMECGMSEHMSNKLKSVIEDRVREGIDFRDFIAACSIPLVGSSSASKLQVDFSISEIDFDLCKQCGLGDKASSNLTDWVELEWIPEMQEVWGQYITYKSQKPANSKGKTVVITGKLTDFKNRTEAKKYLESLGYTVKSSVSKNTDFLVCEDDIESSAYKKATSLIIPIVNIKNLEDN